MIVGLQDEKSGGHQSYYSSSCGEYCMSLYFTQMSVSWWCLGKDQGITKVSELVPAVNIKICMELYDNPF